MAVIFVAAIVAVAYLVGGGHDAQAVIAVLGALAGLGVTSKLDKVEKATNGVATKFAASSFQDGYRAGFADAVAKQPPDPAPVAGKAPYLLEPEQRRP